MCVSFIFAVDDDIVEKLLQLISDVDISDDAKTENFSLKSVAEMLYRQHEHMDSERSDAPHSCNTPDKFADKSAVTVVTSSVTGVCETSVSSSSSRFPFGSTTFVEALHNTTVDSSCNVGRCVPYDVNSHVAVPSPNVQHSQNIFMLTSSPSTPFFCIPTLPVQSPACTGHRRSPEQTGITARQNTYGDGTESIVDRSANILLTDAHNISMVISTCSWASLPNAQSLYSYASSSSVPSLSSSQVILPSNSGCMLPQAVSSRGNSSTLTSASEAVSRISELLSAQCRVIVLMRGCPGSGKTTIARYVCTCILSSCRYSYLMALNSSHSASADNLHIYEYFYLLNN